MPTYISLFNFTEQGIRNVKETTKRARAFEAAAKKNGVRVKGIFWTMGRYDLVMVTEAPNDEAMSREMLKVGSLGNVRTETLRAYSEAEMDKVLKGMK
jgi:uncharacterized protein with GYD domain